MRNLIDPEYQDLVDGIVFVKSPDEVIDEFTAGFSRTDGLEDVFLFERNLSEIQGALGSISQRRRACMELQERAFKIALELSREKVLAETLEKLEKKSDLLAEAKSELVESFSKGADEFTKSGNSGFAEVYAGMSAAAQREIGSLNSYDTLVEKKWELSRVVSKYIVDAMQRPGHILNFRERLVRNYSYIHEDIRKLLSAIRAVEYYLINRMGSGTRYWEFTPPNVFDKLADRVQWLVDEGRRSLIREREELRHYRIREIVGEEKYKRLLSGEEISFTIPAVSDWENLRFVGLSLICDWDYEKKLMNRDYWARALIRAPELEMSEIDALNLGLSYKHEVDLSEDFGGLLPGGLPKEHFPKPVEVGHKFVSASFEPFDVFPVVQHDPRISFQRVNGHGISRRAPSGEWKVSLVGGLTGPNGQTKPAAFNDTKDIIFIQAVAVVKKPDIKTAKR